MKSESPYFYIERKIRLNSVKQLIDLSTGKYFSSPGKPFYQNFITDIPYSTSGIFRGQTYNWPLIPTSFRNRKYSKNENLSEFDKNYQTISDYSQLNTFCEVASQQNKDFPKAPIEQMIIAQHYGITTPLLDWTTNIFVAAYFSINEKGGNSDNSNFRPTIYHLRDERLLGDIKDHEFELKTIRNSCLIKPFPLDRRVERQSSIFTFHPFAFMVPPKIPVDEYQISISLFNYLVDTLGKIGYASSQLFPDYAGLADRIKQGYIL
jgi:hypothetical protein